MLRHDEHTPPAQSQCVANAGHCGGRKGDTRHGRPEFNNKSLADRLAQTLDHFDDGSEWNKFVQQWHDFEKSASQSTGAVWSTYSPGADAQDLGQPASSFWTNTKYTTEEFANCAHKHDTSEFKPENVSQEMVDTTNIFNIACRRHQCELMWAGWSAEEWTHGKANRGERRSTGAHLVQLTAAAAHKHMPCVCGTSG